MALKRYQETFGSVQPDGDVFVLAGASVEVRDESSGALAAIFEDRAGATPKANPFTTDSVGYGFFYAANGRYRITATLSGETVDLRDVGVGFVDFGDGPVSTLTGSQTLETALDDRSVVITSDLTVNIPTDYATLQEAIDDLSTRTIKHGAIIDLVIESGHQPITGVLVEDGDFRHFRISSVDAEVTLGATFPAIDIIKGINSAMPVLNCLINANSLGTNGYFADQGSSGFVTSGSGIKFCNRQACFANYASRIYANNTIWTNSSQEAVGFSGILSWGSFISALGADVSNSNYYGAQAAASGSLDFRQGVANGCAEYGVRATNSGVVNARSSSAQNCSIGYRCFDGSLMNARGSNADGCTVGFYAQHASKLNANDCSALNCTDAGFRVLDSEMNVDIANSTGSVNGFIASEGGRITGTSATANNCTTSAVVCANGALVSLDGSSVFDGCTGAMTISAASGGSIVVRNASIQNSSGIALFADGGSRIWADNATLTGTTGDWINILKGSQVNAFGTGVALGDTNVASFNAIDGSDGIIWA